jgi:hypothetical protein
MFRRRRSRLARCAVASVAVASLTAAVAACGQTPSNPVGSGVSTSGPASASATPSPSAASSARPPAPLTGLPAASAAVAARPAVALAVGGATPLGLGSADIVYEEPGPPVRYLAVYQSSQAARVGPITTINPSDRQVLAVLHPVVGYDGAAAPYFIKLLDATKVTDADYTTHPSLYKAAANGVTTTPRTLTQGVRGATSPPPTFQYRSTGTSLLAATGVSRPTRVTLSIPGLSTQDWRFDSHADRWSLTRGGPAVRAANLIVQDVRYKLVNINRKHGTIMRAAEVTGSGRAEVFSGSDSGSRGRGTAARGTWSKPHLRSLTNYFDSSGIPMAFLPGPTWIILAPPGTHVTTPRTVR